ncbi:MAG: penicillin-binding protein activator LpoB [Kiritimatiellia bacterium]
MKNLFVALSLVAGVSFFAGCTTPTARIDMHNDRGPQVAGLDYRDVQEAANVMLQSLFKSGRLDRTDGQAYVMTVGKVKNDTMQRFDTDTLTAYITEELMNSGKVMVTSALAAGADNRDEMVNAVRTVRGNAEFNANTVAGSGQLVAPTHSLFGKIIQREIRMDNGDKQIEYYFQLRITELASGLQWWQKQHVIGKRADGRTPTW